MLVIYKVFKFIDFLFYYWLIGYGWEIIFKIFKWNVDNIVVMFVLLLII